MQIYSIEGKTKVKFSFIKNLLEDLVKDNKIILISFKRNDGLNIEDLFDMEGMITYDIFDYFLGNISLNDVINEVDKNIDFIIAPFLEDKYIVKKEDIINLITNLSSYDYIILDNLDKDMIENKKSIKIISNNEVDEKIDTDYFYIEAEENFDPRIVRDVILEKSSKYLGMRKKNDSYETIFHNLKMDKKGEIEKLSFIEKIRLRFKK